MSLRSWWTAYREHRIRKLLAAHPAEALAVLRREPDLGAQALRTLYTGDALPDPQAFERMAGLDAAGRRPARETAAYPVLSTMGHGGTSPLLRTLPKYTNFAIRNFSESPPARRAINAIKDPISDMPWTIGLRKPVGAKQYATQADPTDDQHQRIVAATEMLIRPNDSQTGREVVQQLAEDLVVMGGGVLETQRNHSDARPYFLFPVDVQSIRINANWVPGSREFRYSQGRGYVFGALGTTDDVKLADDEMVYMRLNPRSNTPFGYGYLEAAFAILNAFLGAFTYAERRASNNTPNFGIFLGENMTFDQVRRWQHYWQNEIEGNGEVPILGGGRAPQTFTLTGTGADSLYLKWQEWCVRIIAMAFGISPMKLSLERDVNRSTAETQESNDWVTIAPVANIIRDGITHDILWKRLGWTDLEFFWQVRTADELKQATILAEQYDGDMIYVDELRQVYERPPLPDGLGQMTKTAYQAAIKAAAGLPAQGQSDGDVITPFDQERDTLSPDEGAFVRELMRRQRRERGGLAAVAG